MRKFILSILLPFFYIGVFATNTLNTSALPLSTSGSVTIYASQLTQLYLINGNDSLTGDLSIIFSGTPLTGSQFTLWFNNTNINLTTHKFYILSQDYGSVIGGTQNVFVTCTYNGSAWTVSNINKTILTYLSNYVTEDELTATLAGYVDTGSLTSTLINYALLSGANFSGLTAPTRPITDSTANVATTAFIRRWWQATDSFTTARYVNNAITNSIAASTSSITSAYISYINGAIQTFQNNPTIDSPWAAGTYNLNTLATGVNNTIQPPAINGNIILACPSPPTLSEVTIILPFSGSFTVTAGTGVVITATHTGAATHVSVLTLVWSNVANAYVEKSFMQN